MRNIHIITAHLFLKNLVFAYVIERLFWESRSMDVRDVVFTEIIYIVAVLLFEIPAGIVSDRLSRKAVLIGAALLQTVEFAIVIYASRFFHFALVAAIAGVVETLTSGTLNAAVYESLAAEGKEHTFAKVLGRVQMVENGTVVAALLIGGFLAERTSMVALYWIAVIGSVLSAIALTFLTEPSRTGPSEEHHSSMGILRESAIAVFRTPRVLSAVVAGISIGAGIVYLDEFITLFLRDSGMPVWSFGVVVAAAYLFRSAGSLLGHTLEGTTRNGGFFPAVVAAFLALQVLFGVVSLPPALVVVGVLYLMWGALDVLSLSVLHRAVESHFRATAESVVSQMEQIVSLLFGLLFSWFAGPFGIAGAVARTAAVALALYALYRVGAVVRSGNGRRST
ncbi:MAG: MFS transporter [Spirochaetales bacterium]|nr:MFS transporter [Spirochaetales bacterium]